MEEWSQKMSKRKKKKTSQRTLKNRAEYLNECQFLNTMPVTSGAKSTSIQQEFIA